VTIFDDPNTTYDSLAIAYDGGLVLTIPAMTYEWSPTTAGLATPSYTPLAALVTHCNIKRGRPDEFSQVEAGVCELTLFDPARNFDPTWTGGIYGSNVTLDKRIRVSATWADTPYRLFTGFIESVTPQWSEQTSPYIKIVAVDALKSLNLKRIVGTAYHDAIVAAAPFVYYRMGQKDRSLAVTDEFSPANDGTYFGNPGGAPVGSVTVGIPGALPAETDTAVDFGMHEGSAVLPSWVSFTGTGEFAIECWVMPRSAAGGLPQQVDRIIHQGTGSGGFGGSTDPVQLLIADDFTVALTAWDGGPNGGTLGSTVPLNLYEWNHVVAVKGGTTGPLGGWHIYLNGVDVSDATTATTYGTGNCNLTAKPVYIGFRPDVTMTATGGSKALDGALDELAFYRRYVTAAEAAAHYAAAGGFRKTARTGARLNAILDAVAWPAGDRNIDTGGFDIQPAPSPLWKQTVLAYAKAVAASDGYPAILFVDGDNKVVFYDRNRAVPSPSGTYGESYFPYEFPIEPHRTDTDYWNEVVADASNLPTQTAAASLPGGSIIRTQTISGLVNAHVADVATIAADALARGNNPSPLRLPALRIHPLDDPANLYPQVLGSELMARKTVRRDRNVDGAGGMVADVRIQHVEHDISHETGDWHTTWQLAPT
jgi:hypothetical protein